MSVQQTTTTPAEAAYDALYRFFTTRPREDPAFEALWPYYGVIREALEFLGTTDAPAVVEAWNALDELARRLPEGDPARARAEAARDKLTPICNALPRKGGVVIARSYRLRRATPHAPEGATVYRARHGDWGMATADTRHHGKPFLSVTLDERGGFPTFTVPGTAQTSTWPCSPGNSGTSPPG